MDCNYHDITGQTFERWTVLEYLGNSKWLCKCECGTVKSVQLAHLKNGTSLSCGCYAKEKTAERTRTHGEASKKAGKATRLYRIWYHLAGRCENPNDDAYSNYGGRGITIYPEWRKSYTVFREWSLQNGYKDNLSIDRIDNNGNYEPGNCRWTTAKEQCNNKRNNHLLTCNGETKTMAQWAEEVGINYDTLKRRIKLGWPIDKALYAPLRRVKQQ